MNLHDEIARVAYDLWEKGGRCQGRDPEYWLEAEKIVLSRFVVEEPQPEPEKPAKKAAVKTAAKKAEPKVAEPKKKKTATTARQKKTRE